MKVETSSGSVDVGSQFVATLSIIHANPGAVCVDESEQPLANPPFGCYTGAQWNLDYDETKVDLLPLNVLADDGIV